MRTHAFFVLFAMPVSCRQYVESARASPRSDYMDLTLTRNTYRLVWRQRYRDIVRAAQALIARLSQFSVPYVVNATLPDLCTATKAARVVVLFAHWRGSGFRVSDIGASADVVRRLSADPDVACRLQLTPASDPSEVVQALNRFVRPSDPLGPPEALERLATQRRDWLDRRLPGIWTPGNCLELSDGLHRAEAVEAALASDFDGTLDACCCTSMHLAAVVKRSRGDALRIMYNAREIDPLPAYLTVSRVIEHCLRSGDDYRLVRLQVEALLARGGAA